MAKESTYTEEEAARARKVLKMAVAWRERNPHAYGVIERLAMEEAERGRSFGCKYLTEMIRQHHIVTDCEGEYFKLNNNYAPVFARWLAAEHPAIAHKVRMRPCAFDQIMCEDAEDDGAA